MKPKQHEATARSPRREQLDIAKVRRNWSRALVVPLAPSQPAEPAPVDPFAVARALVARIEKLARACFPDRRSSLDPFLSRASELVEKLATMPSGAAEMPEVKEELRTILADLEDLFEVYDGLLR